MKANLFLIGAQKSGTTALATFLAEHPEIYMSPSKEPAWFAGDFQLGAGRGEVTLRTESDYNALFSDAPEGTKYALDGSTVYLASQTAVDRLLVYQPKAKVIVLIRNLVTMAHASHMEAFFNLLEDQSDFETAWGLQEARANGDHVPRNCVKPKRLQYKTICSVGTQLERVVAKVPKEQLLILFHEDFVRDPRVVWDQTMAFLRLPSYEEIDLTRQVAPAHFNRFPAIARLYRHRSFTPIRQKLIAALRATGSEQFVKNALVRRGQREEISEKFEKELVQAFAPEVEKIEQLTGRDLSHWKPKQADA